MSNTTTPTDDYRILSRREFFKLLNSLGIVVHASLTYTNTKTKERRLVCNYKATGRSVYHYQNDFTTPEHQEYRRIRHNGEAAIAYRSRSGILTVIS